MKVVLWVIQVLLAALFIFAGGVKLVMPIDEMAQQMHMPGLFLRLIGVAEVLGAMGLILPSLLRVRPYLTSIAAAGLVIIMIGATVVSIPFGMLALLPFVTGLLAAFVAYGRWRVAPIRSRTA